MLRTVVTAVTAVIIFLFWDNNTGTSVILPSLQH